LNRRHADFQASPDFARYYRQQGAMRATDRTLYVRLKALLAVLDQRIWKTDTGGAHTVIVITAAAVAKCSFSNGFDVDDLVARARALPRPQPRRLDEPWHTERMLVCDKCGACWGESKGDGHRPDCSP
jgi:hypothetical protein